MSVSYLPPEALRKSVIDIIADCRKNLTSGYTDITQVESSVRAYCESISRLPLEESKAHQESLHELMQLVTELGEELTQARDAVKEELSKLENMRKAHAAYKTFDIVGRKKEENLDD